MKKYFFVIVLGFVCNCLNAQILSGNSVLWEPSTIDARVLFKFYTKGVMIGNVESGELLIENMTSHKLFVKVKYVLTDYCGNATREYSKQELLEPETRSKSSGAFFSGIDYETTCMEKRKYSDKISSIINRVSVYIESIEDLTLKEEEEKRRKMEEEEKRKVAEANKKKEVEEKRIADEKIKKRKEEERLAKEEEVKNAKKEADQKIEKELAEKENAAKEIKDESERKLALEKIEKEKVVMEKKIAEKKVARVMTDVEKEAAYLEFQRKQKESQAKVLEKEGDNFNALGSMFMDAALKKYQEAQEQYYNYAVQVKIDKILATKQAVTLIKDGMEKVDEFLSDTRQTFDDAGWPQWRVTSFSYEALAPSFKGFETQKLIVPKAYSISYGFYRLIALEVGLKYQQSPVYSFGLEDNNGKYIGKDIEASNTTLGPELLLGLGSGGKKLAFYVMYGYYFPLFGLSGTSYTSGYEYKGDFKDAFQMDALISKLKAGVFYRIPKTNIGIGVYYCMNGVNGEKLLYGGSVDVIDRSRGLEDKYGLGPGKNSSLDRLKYSSIGFSFIIKDR